MADQKGNRLYQLLDLGQSIWLDSIRRGQIQSGELQHLIDDDALRGETANPTIFEKAIGGSSDYDQQIVELMGQGLDANAIYERVATDDVRAACDVFRPIYDRTDGGDGFVSLEVSPKLAYDTEGTLKEVRRFWQIVGRPNLMIKIPGTPQGVPAIETALYEGINVNITLLFAVEAYEQVAWAYIRALERRAAEGQPIDHIASVASFFVSRIDTLADKQLGARIKEAKDEKTRKALESLKGKIAIANAKVAYARFQAIFGDPRFEALKTRGAKVQRPLWASTSTKDPAYPDTLYVDTLIGPDTINTLPLETILAFKDHGTAARTVDQGLDEARAQIEQFESLGLSLDAVTDQVLKEGVEKFDESFDKLIKVIEGKRAAIQQNQPPAESAQWSVSSGPGGLGDVIKKRLAEAAQDRVVERVWQGDATLWSDRKETQEAIRQRLGWLKTIQTMRSQVGELKKFADEVIGAGFKHVLLLGMGGSSLAPEVMQYTFGIGRGYPNLSVLDSTDPATVREYLREMSPADTLYLVSSKSGTTIETLSFYKYFYGRVYDLRGERAGSSFVAITDPGTPLEKLAKERKFRKIFSNPPDIGGRYSALSYFGLVPAALMGIDLDRLLASAEQMARACEAGAPESGNPGLWLGAVLAELYAQGRDKITFILTPQMGKFGLWAEQLLAESTGKPSEKDGKPRGLVPIVDEPLGAPDEYSTDRVFVYMSLEEYKDDATDKAVAALEGAGEPVIRLRVEDRYALGGEFFRWEFATAIAGLYMGINPFDEPNVAESKANTNKLLEEYATGCKLPVFEDNASVEGITLYWDAARNPRESAQDYLREFLDSIKPGDYVALLAFITHSPASDKALAAARVALRRRYHAATTLGYGPRFLHSTGQLYKGGPNEGVFVQITADDAKDANIPGQEYTFGVLKEAQALGDLQALEDRGRRVLRLHLASGTDIARIQELITSALESAEPAATAATSGNGKDGQGAIETSTTGRRTTTPGDK